MIINVDGFRLQPALEKNAIFSKKGVDTERRLCYFNIAVARDRKKDLKKI